MTVTVETTWQLTSQKIFLTNCLHKSGLQNNIVLGNLKSCFFDWTPICEKMPQLGEKTKHTWKLIDTVSTFLKCVFKRKEQLKKQCSVQFALLIIVWVFHKSCTARITQKLNRQLKQIVVVMKLHLKKNSSACSLNLSGKTKRLDE